MIVAVLIISLQRMTEYLANIICNLYITRKRYITTVTKFTPKHAPDTVHLSYDDGISSELLLFSKPSKNKNKKRASTAIAFVDLKDSGARELTRREQMSLEKKLSALYAANDAAKSSRAAAVATEKKESEARLALEQAEQSERLSGKKRRSGSTFSSATSSSSALGQKGGPRPRTKSSYRGVSSTKGGKWEARASFAGKKNFIGTFVDEKKAARAYDAFLQERGVDRPYNFPVLDAEDESGGDSVNESDGDDGGEDDEGTARRLKKRSTRSSSGADALTRKTKKRRVQSSKKGAVVVPSRTSHFNGVAWRFVFSILCFFHTYLTEYLTNKIKKIL